MYRWMQVTIISSHYLIKHDLTNTSLMNIYNDKLNPSHHRTHII